MKDLKDMEGMKGMKESPTSRERFVTPADLAGPASPGSNL